ncbi:MAG: hypothetical protein CL840_04795 [Crocinitomicaceae bacterium]|nr:hypothetical protein [Crocinitomicaceae bacterium]
METMQRLHVGLSAKGPNFYSLNVWSNVTLFLSPKWFDANVLFALSDEKYIQHYFFLQAFLLKRLKNINANIVGNCF